MTKFAESYPTPRHLAYTFGKAKMGRGRMSTEAKVLIEEARKAGVTFESESAQAAVDSGVPKSETVLAIPNHLNTDIPRDGFNYAKRPSSTEIRVPTRYTGKTVEGYVVGWESCSRCAQHSTFCACPGGVRPPSVVVEILSETAIDTDSTD